MIFVLTDFFRLKCYFVIWIYFKDANTIMINDGEGVDKELITVLWFVPQT